MGADISFYREGTPCHQMKVLTLHKSPLYKIIVLTHGTHGPTFVSKHVSTKSKPASWATYVQDFFKIYPALSKHVSVKSKPTSWATFDQHYFLITFSPALRHVFPKIYPTLLYRINTNLGYASLISTCCAIMFHDDETHTLRHLIL